MSGHHDTIETPTATANWHLADVLWDHRAIWTRTTRAANLAIIATAWSSRSGYWCWCVRSLDIAGRIHDTEVSMTHTLYPGEAQADADASIARIATAVRERTRTTEPTTTPTGDTAS